MRDTATRKVERGLETPQGRCAERLHADEEGCRGAPSPGGPAKQAAEQGERGRLGPDLRMLSRFSRVSLQPGGL